MTNLHTTDPEDIRVPAIVQEKCSAAYDQIRAEAAQQQSQKRRSTKKIIAIVSAAAAAAVGLSFALPAMAQSGMLRNIFDYFSSGTTTVNEPTKRNNLRSYACAVNMTQSGENGTVTLQDVYFDGENICWTMLMENLPEEAQDSTNLAVMFEATLDGQTLEIRDSDFTPMGDGSFASSMSAKYEGEAAGTLPLKITFSCYDALNFNYYVLGTDGEYTHKATYQIPLELTFETDVTPRTDMNLVYDVNQTDGGFTLESVTVTPFATLLKLNGDFTSYEQVEMTDQCGTRYESIWDGTSQSNDRENASFEAPLTSASQLQISIVDHAQDGLPTMAAFTVDIQPGTRTAAPTPQPGEATEIIYDPPLEETDTDDDAFYQEQITFPNAGNFKSSIDFIALPEEGTTCEHDFLTEDIISVHPDKAYFADPSEIESLVNAYDNGENYDRQMEIFLKDCPAEDVRLLLVDYTMTSKCSHNLQFCIDSLSITREDGLYPIAGYSVAYCSEKDLGGDWYNWYLFSPGETRTLTVGYLITAETAAMADEGFTLFDSGRGFSSSGTARSDGCAIPVITP